MVEAAADADSSTLADTFPGKTKEQLVASIDRSDSSHLEGAPGGVVVDQAVHEPAVVTKTDFGDSAFMNLASTTPFEMSAFMNLASTTPFEMSVSEAAANLAEACSSIHSHDPEVVTRAAFTIRKALAATTSPPCQQVIEAGAVPRLVELISTSADVRTIFEAAWAITNIASGTSAQTRHVVDCGAVPPLLELLSSPSAEVREQAIWCLGNVCGDGADLRDLCISQGIAAHIVTLLSSQQLGASLPFRRNTVWAASNVCRGKPPAPFETMQVMVPALAAMLLDDDEEVLGDSCWALSYASDGANERIQLLLECGLVDRIVELATHDSPNVITPALRVLGNIVTGDDGQTAAAISAGCIPVLVNMLSNTKESIRKESAWTLSNIFAGTRDQIQACTDAGAVEPLLQLLREDSPRVAKEALWAVANSMAGCDAEQAAIWMSSNVEAALVEALTRDDSLVAVAADAIVKLVGHSAEILPSLLDAGLEDALGHIANSHPAEYETLCDFL